MITKFKLYESKLNTLLLCVEEPSAGYYREYTKGKKYNIYNSNLGIRIKDNNGNYDRLKGVGDDDYWKSEEHNKVFIYNYAGGIFTTDDSIEDYKFRENTKKYNL